MVWADGLRGKPGMVMTSPRMAARNSAPFDNRTFGYSTLVPQ